MAIATAGCIAPESLKNPVDNSPPAQAFEGALGDGAAWKAEMPANWNGTLLLFAHGYNRELSPPQTAPADARALLLAHGYALAASAYPAAGWAVAEAVPSQLAALDAFSARFGKPQRVIAWGSSMGGLVTSALAELHGDRIDGALPMCASSMGALPMMNMAFDGAHALTVLFPTDPAVQVIGAGDNFDGIRRVMTAVQSAEQTPAGRARIALAGVLGGIPDWTQADLPRPAANDVNAIAAQIARVIQFGVLPPRGDQEMRAGGVYSWNTGIDYHALVAATGRRPMLEALYREAGIQLDDDLARLNSAPRAGAEADAVAYMMENYTPNGRVDVPVLAIHTIGDGMTSPSLQREYVEKIRAAGRPANVAAGWIERAGHCTQNGAEMLAAIITLEQRIESGQWRASATELNSVVSGGGTVYIDYQPAPMPRHCDEASGCDLRGFVD
ncbi:MAG: alpha/beta hydrolase [Gammaproteobacteria bacterium]|nr:alpha/beta hydrolase [Gammaproteobacteria bacterium]